MILVKRAEGCIAQTDHKLKSFRITGVFCHNWFEMSANILIVEVLLYKQVKLNLYQVFVRGDIRVFVFCIGFHFVA